MCSQENYKHLDTDDSTISLHDCEATRIVIEDDRLSFYFENGFWITDGHKENNLTDTVRTDPSRVDFNFKETDIADISVYVFRKNLFSRTVREEWSIHKLQKLVNSSAFALEFLYQYKGHNELLYDCLLHSDKKPYDFECQLKIPAAEVTYFWNDLCPDKKW